MALPRPSLNFTSAANSEKASEHASSQSSPQRKSQPIAWAGYAFASENTKPSLRCNRSSPIGPLPERKSNIHSMCRKSNIIIHLLLLRSLQHFHHLLMAVLEDCRCQASRLVTLKTYRFSPPLKPIGSFESHLPVSASYQRMRKLMRPVAADHSRPWKR